MSDFNKMFDELTAFDDHGSLQEFIEWVDANPDWVDPRIGSVKDHSYLIRRDTQRQAAEAVMRRHLARNYSK